METEERLILTFETASGFLQEAEVPDQKTAMDMVEPGMESGDILSWQLDMEVTTRVRKTVSNG